MAAMEATVGYATVTALEVSGSGGMGGGEGEGGKGGGEVIAPSSWGLGCSGNRGGGSEVAVRVEAAVGWEAKRSPHNNNGESSSSSNFQRSKQQQQQQ